MRHKPFVKIIASALILTFSYSQLLWAADVRQMILDAKAFFDAEEAKRPGSSMSAADLQASQTQQQAVVAQQQVLQDFQNTTFSLTTPNGDVLKYVGDKLNAVTRPDGTKLNNILTDAAGNILNADLKLADGSIQIYQAGQVIGYRTPDGSQVIYSAGVIQKVIDKNNVETLYFYTRDAQGNVTETTLDNPSYTTKYDQNKKIKEATRKSDNQKIYYTNGMIDRIQNSDGSQVLFTTTTVGTDTAKTPQGGTGTPSNTYIDVQGNKFYFSNGAITKIDLADGSFLDNITWDANNKIDSANLTQVDLQKFIYQSKQLTRSYDAANVVTNYTYTATTITAATAGNTFEYLTDKTPTKLTALDGTVTTLLTTGTYKGLKDTETSPTGTKYVYEYTGSGSSITVQKREVLSTVYNIITFDSSTVIAQSSNPGFKTTFQFANDGSIDQSVVLTAFSGTSKNLKLNLLSGTGSAYTWNGTTTSLGVTLNKGTDYKVEIRWETGRVGMYVYAASAAKPSTPTMSITDRAWDPTFKAVATNSLMTFDGTSSGYYNRNIETRERNYNYLSTSPVMKVDFNRIAANYKTLYFRVTQVPSGNITRTLTYWLDPTGIWYTTISDYNSSTNTTTNTYGSLAQNVPAGVNYTAELRIESGKANLYVYEKALGRPAAPVISLNAFNVATRLESSLVNATGQGAQYKNMTSPTYSSTQSTALTVRVDTITSSSIVKPAAPSVGVNTTDFTSITYDALSNLKQVLLKDGTKLVFNQGILQQAFNAAGELTTFNFSQSALSNITGSSIVQSNLTSTYSSEGKLSSIQLPDLTIHYKADGSTVEWIEKTDGTELWNLVFNTQGILTDALIISPDGEERTYVAGKLTQLRRPDQSQLFYVNSQVTKMITPEKLTYNFDYTIPSIVKAILDTTLVPTPDALTPIQMEYDTSFSLKKVIRQNQEVLNYLNTDLKQIDAPNTASKVFSYTKDASGNVLSYTVTQGNVLTNYDANNQPLTSVISPDASNPNTLNISYQYGKIRQVKKNNVVTFNYTYSFDAAGTEITQVEDIETNTNKTYQDSNLTSSLDNNTSVLSSYAYESFVIASPEGAKQSMRVKQVQVSRFGRTLHTYQYAYNGTNTIVTDETNVIRTYDANQKMTFLEKEGQKFSYTYSQTTVASGPPVTQQTILPVTTLGTSARSTGSQSWQIWNTDTTDNSLSILSNGWVTYNASLSQAGDLKIDFDSTQFNGPIPSTYQFKLDIAVDGVMKTQYLTPLGTGWKANTLTLTGLSQGAHSIKISWVNDYYVAGQYDANFKFKNLKMTHLYQTAPPPVAQEIVEEQLVEKKLSDGALLKYQSGKLSEIVKTDGSAIKNIVTDTNGKLTEAKLFSSSTDIVGKKIYFTDGQISKVTLPTGQDLLYSYDKDASGNIVNTWVTKGAVKLKYDAQSNLQGLKINGVLDPSEIMQQIQHVYQGGSGGSFSVDGNFDTAQADAFGGGAGSATRTLSSQNDLPIASAITGLSYRFYAFAYSSGSTDNGSSAYSYIETKDATTGLWTIVPGSYLSSSHNNGGGGGSTAGASTSTTPTTLAVNIPNAIAVRAVVSASAFANQSGNIGGSVSIYEIQFTVADQANLNFSTTTNSSGQATGYALSGYKGSIQFDAAGNVTQSNAALLSVQNELAGNIQNYAKAPTKNSDFSILYAALADIETIVTQEYSSNGTLETQTKADGTVTLFDNNKPSKVLDITGRILIQYTYDAAGNPTRIYLKNARDTLPGEVIKAKESIEQQRAEALRSLAAQRNLAYQSIQNQYQNQRININAQLATLESQYSDVSNASAKGKAAKSAKGDALNAIGGQVDQIRAALTTSYDNEADTYATLDAQVLTLSNQIETDSQSAFTELTNQETNLKKEILRQEVSPIVYDYYRRIIGRDPDSTEYNYWINLIDYASGNTLAESKTTAGQNLTTALNSYINALPELGQRQTYVSTIKTNVTSQINSYLTMTQAQKEAFAATLGLTPQDLVPFSSADSAKILTWLNSRSLHFGQSAFLSLESLLDQKNITYTRETLAKQAILIDILTGVISPLDDGDLVLSMFALNKTAKLYSVDLTGANLSWDDLKSVYDSNKAIRFDGSGDYLSIADSADWAFETGDLTIDMRIKLNANSSLTFFDHSDYATNKGLELVYDPGKGLGFTNDGSKNLTRYVSWTPALNEWYHVAFTRSAGTIRWFVNGTQVGSSLTNSGDFTAGNTRPVTIGATYDTRNSTYRTYLDGWLVELRISKGIARWTGNFTPPTAAPNPDQYTKLLLQTDSQGVIKDLSAAPHPVLINGDTKSDGSVRDSRIIAHINGNHYVIVTAITDTTITYIDPAIGKDKQNESLTVTKTGFLKVWQGNVTLNQTDYNVIQVRVTTGQSTAKTLSGTELKANRGAGWDPLDFILGLGSDFLLFTPLAPFAIGYKLYKIGVNISEGNWLAVGIDIASFAFQYFDFGQVLSNVFTGFGQALGPLGQFFNIAYQAVTGFFNSAFGFLPGIGKGLVAQNIGQQIVNQALYTGITVGVSKGLESLGVNPQIAGFLGNLTSGAVMANIVPQTRNLSNELVSRADMIRTSVQQTIILQQVGQLGLSLGLDPGFTNILGLSLGAIQGVIIQNPTTSLQKAFDFVKPQIAASLFKYNIQKIGDAIGLNPFISSAIAAPISTTLADKLYTTKWTGQVPSSAQDGATINPNYYYDVERGINVPIPVPGSQGRAWWDTTLTFLRNNLPLMATASISAYYATRPQTIASGQTAPPPTTIEIPLPQGAIAVSYQDYFTGATKAGYQINSSSTSYIIYDRASGLPVKRVSSGVVEEGVFETVMVLKADGTISVDYVNPKYISKGQVKYTTDVGGQARFKILDSKVQEIYIDATSADVVLNPGTVRDANNKVLNGIVKILTLGLELSVTNGAVSKSTGGQQGSEELTKKARTAYIFGNGFNNLIVSEGTVDVLMPLFSNELVQKGIVDPLRRLFVALYETTSLLGNLFDWFSDFVTYNNQPNTNTPLDLAQELVARLGHDPLLFAEILAGVVNINTLPQALQNPLRWMKETHDQWFGGLKNNLVDEVYNDLVAFDDAKGIVDGIVFTHSGAFQPFMKAIQRAKADGSKFDIHTIINYEGPYWLSRTDYIDNPNLKRIINVWGTRFDAAPPIWSFDDAKFRGPNLAPNINIKILGAKHNDFSYSATDPRWTPNPNANKRLEREINFKTSVFMQDLYRAAKSEDLSAGNLLRFLQTTPGVSKDASGVWVVDPKLLDYQLDYVY